MQGEVEATGRRPWTVGRRDAKGQGFRRKDVREQVGGTKAGHESIRLPNMQEAKPRLPQRAPGQASGYVSEV